MLVFTVYIFCLHSFFLASYSTSLFGQVRELARPSHSRAVCFRPEVTQLFALPTIGWVKLCCNTETCHIRVSFCPQFLSSVLSYFSQRAATHLERFEISFQSLAFMVIEKSFCLWVIHSKFIFTVILGFISELIS